MHFQLQAVYMKTFGKIFGSVAFAVISTTSALAADYTYNDILSASSPSFIRPGRSFGDYRYSSFGFSVSATGSYQLTTQAPTYDGYLFLYTGSFDAGNPGNNLLSSNDDAGGYMSSSLSTILSAGVNYYAVNTTYSVASSNANFYPNAAGLSLTISGPGNVTPLAAVPEPETYAMLLAGLGMMGFVARRKVKRKNDQISAA